jgi:CheY-like chemotaxis protein
MSDANTLLKILIVDDSPEDREAYKRILNKNEYCSYQFTEAETVADAVDVLHNQTPDCILLDYQLPDGDGLELLEELAAKPGTSQVPVIFLTGQGSEEVAVQAMKQGAQDYLVKNTLSPNILYRTIHSAIERTELQRTISKQQEEKDKLIAELKEALAQVKQLGGLLPICSNCKKIRDDSGYWQQVEKYLTTHSEAIFSHGICPECVKTLYPEFAHKILKKE